jgi:hypothetical protein
MREVLARLVPELRGQTNVVADRGVATVVSLKKERDTKSG